MIYITLNDVFAYACADAEELETTEVEKVLEIYKKYSYDGLIAWVAVKRNIEPLTANITPRYIEAKKYIKDLLSVQN